MEFYRFSSRIVRQTSATSRTSRQVSSSCKVRPYSSRKLDWMEVGFPWSSKSVLG